MNITILTGRLTKEVELKVTNSGKKVTQFTLAVQRDKDNADFINCVAWEKTAELLQAYTNKGSKIVVNGSLRTRDYQGTDGKKVYVTEVLVNQIELLDKKQEQPKVEQPKSVQTSAFERYDEEVVPF